MNRAMFAGVAGLKTHQTKMDVIGNNIANVNTYGYKSQRAVFADLMYQSIRGASAGSANRGGTNPSSVGYGSSLAGIQSQMTTSSMQSTGFGLDVAITGEGFLQVMDGDGNIFYTKAGMLDYDSQGYLTDINGNFVLGAAGADGKPGSQKIQLNNIGSVDAKKPAAEQEINGVKYKIEASNADKAGNVGITLGASTELPAGMKAQAIISNTGAILVNLNSYETFNSITELNKAINDAVTEANGGKTHAAGTFTLTADPSDMFGSAAKAGAFTGEAFAKKAELKGNGTFFDGKLEISAFTPDKKGVGTASVDNNAFTVTAGTTAGSYKFEATINSVKYTLDNVTTATTVPLKLTSPDGGVIELKATPSFTQSDLAGFSGKTFQATSTPPNQFLGGGKIKSVSTNFAGAGTPTFTLSGVTDTPQAYNMAITVGGKTYTPNPATLNLATGGDVEFKSATGDSITMTLPTWADMAKNFGVDGDPATANAKVATMLQASITSHNYKLSPATSQSSNSLTGAEIAGSNFKTKPGEFTGTGIDKIVGGLKIKGTSSNFTGSGSVTGNDFTATYTAAAGDKKAFWTVSMTVGGKAYTADIGEDTAASSVLLKNGDEYIQVSNPGFKALSDSLDITDPAAQPLLQNGETIDVSAATPSRDLGLGATFALTGGTAGGAITLDQLSSISIGSDGTVTVSHPDKGTVVAGKISLANFANSSGLQQMGNNYYSMSANSGEAKLCDPGSDGTGALKSNALEMSNVDLSGEFADMITTQRGFQANSRIITVSDTMLEELINLKR